MYKALIEIGGYKVGEEVPAEKAEVWMRMYKNSPVELVNEDKKVSSKEEKKVEVNESSKEESEVKSEDFVLDDYLERNTRTVVANIEKDSLTKEQLGKLLQLENSGKSRKNVIDAINKKLED